MKTFLLSLLAAALLFGPPAYAQTTQPLDGIAAVVDEDVILQSELDRAVANILAQYASRQDQLPPRDVLQRQVLERLILVRLQTARAQSTGVRISDEEVDAAISNIARQNNTTPEQLRQQLASDGLSFADFRNSIRDELLIQRLRQRFAQSRVSVSDAEVDAALAAQSIATQYHLAHILVGVPEGATPEQIATAQQKIDGVKGLIGRGEMAFSAAAVRYSDSPNALEGGDLGWRSLDEIPTAFANSIRSMQPGQVIGPIRGPSGFQLLQLVESRTQAADAGNRVTQFAARQILVAVGAQTDDAAAKAKADTLAARLAGGADFAALAAEASDDAATKRRGGDLGWITTESYGTTYAMQVAALADGQVSAPFRTDAGWVIVQRTGSRQVGADDENRRAQIRETIGRRKLEEEWNRFLRELRGEAYVDIHTGAATPPSGG